MSFCTDYYSYSRYTSYKKDGRLLQKGQTAILFCYVRQRRGVASYFNSLQNDVLFLRREHTKLTQDLLLGFILDR